jgi:hypothetical protein
MMPKATKIKQTERVGGLVEGINQKEEFKFL